MVAELVVHREQHDLAVWDCQVRGPGIEAERRHDLTAVQGGVVHEETPVIGIGVECQAQES